VQRFRFELKSALLRGRLEGGMEYSNAPVFRSSISHRPSGLDSKIAPGKLLVIETHYHPRFPPAMFPASPIVLATVAGNSATQRLQLLLVSLPEGGNRLELRQQSWSETVG
jgi:hypothetical protein